MKTRIATTTKKIGVPVTVLEKFEILKKKNPEIVKLREAFDLDISL
jgi:hypothetical protein